MIRDGIRYDGTNWIFVGFLLLLAVAAVFVISNMPLTIPLVLLLGISLLLITLVRTDLALVILIFSMLLSPEIILGRVPGRDIVIRLDDVFIFVIFFGWLAKMAINKELGLLRRTPLNGLIISYIVVCIISTVMGMIAGNIKGLKS